VLKEVMIPATTTSLMALNILLLPNDLVKIVAIVCAIGNSSCQRVSSWPLLHLQQPANENCRVAEYER
jgi:hypothetical protein